jgi:hypothetical protein
MGSGSQKTTQSGVSDSQSTSSSSYGIDVPDYLQPLATTAANVLNTNILGGSNQLSDYSGDYIRGVSGLGALEGWAAEKIPTMWDEPSQRSLENQYIDLANTLAGKQATGENIATNPAVLAASDAYEKLMRPEVENQMGLSGLGRSSALANALATGKTTHMTTTVENALAREQESYQNQAAQYSTSASLLEDQINADTSRKLSAISAASSMGATQRSLTQAYYDAIYENFIRKQALAEQAVYTPFGATATASIGQKGSSESQSTSDQVSSGTGTASSGLFK